MRSTKARDGSFKDGSSSSSTNVDPFREIQELFRYMSDMLCCLCVVPKRKAIAAIVSAALDQTLMPCENIKRNPKAGNRRSGRAVRPIGDAVRFTKMHCVRACLYSCASITGRVGSSSFVSVLIHV